MLERLVNELQSGKWTAFRCAIAFGKQSGNIPTLISALDLFLVSGGEVSVTFGADTFSGRTKGTDLGRHSQRRSRSGFAMFDIGASAFAAVTWHLS